MALPLHPSEQSSNEDEEEYNINEETNKSNNNTNNTRRCCSLSMTQVTAMISNLSTSYNTTNISLTLPILHHLLQTPQSEREKHDGLIASSLLAGMAVGQVLGGTLGDVIGRKKALGLVICLQMVASVGSASIPQESGAGDGGEMMQLVVWRFVLGVGAGGVYPLAAVISAEDDNNNNHNNNDNDMEASSSDIKKLRQVALTFSTQGIGFLLVPLLTWILLSVCKEEKLFVVWRMLLAMGALPGFILFAIFIYTNCHTNAAAGLKTWCSCCCCCIGTKYVWWKRMPCWNKRRQLNESAEDRYHHQPSDDHNNDDDDDIQNNPPPQQVSLLELGIDHDKEHQYHEPLLMSHNSYLHEYENKEQQQQEDDKWNNEKDDGQSFHTAHHDPLSINTNHPSSPESESHYEKKGLWQSIKSEPHLLRKLCGTAGTWFLFDVLFYGNTLFQPVVLEAAFGSNHHNKDNQNKNEEEQQQFHLLVETARDGLILALLALPGYFVSAMVVGRYTSCCCSCWSGRKRKCGTIHQTPKYIQTQGFFFMSLLYFLIGSLWKQLRSVQALLILLYGGTFFFANYGPNATTFMLPSITYSHDCRSTLNGISAAAGKLGALVGAMVFEPAAEKWGDDVVMLICAGVSVLALVLTRVCIVEDDEVGSSSSVIDSGNSSGGGGRSASFSLIEGEQEEKADGVNEVI